MLISEAGHEGIYFYPKESLDSLWRIEPKEIIEDIIRICEVFSKMPIFFENDLFAMLATRKIEGISMLLYLQKMYFKDVRINHNPKYGPKVEVLPRNKMNLSEALKND